MSNEVAIRVENLGKKYVISHKAGGGGQSYERLSEKMAHAATAPFRKLRSQLSSLSSPKSPPSALTPPSSFSSQVSALSSREDFWALKDVSFEVKRGEVVGIIGRNGAGKSTLLKILSRITEPTTGRVEINGRVASLLEVGTGFHPELTGRENIYLNGAILGMTRVEIRSKFDEIVAFAEVEKFLDTPVKRYSSGMYVRLAFAVAAHLEPEILIVDEVLAVGDAQFQKKCLGKMGEVSREGRTVLLVSHQMGVISQLCHRSIILDNGTISFVGETPRAIERYLDQSAGNMAGFTASSGSSKDISLVRAQILSLDGAPSQRFSHRDEIIIEVTCQINQWIPSSELRIVVREKTGRTVFTSDAELDVPALRKATRITARATIPNTFLRPNIYAVTLAAFVPHQVIIDLVEEALMFTVIDGGSKYAASEGIDYGVVFANCNWDIKCA